MLSESVEKGRKGRKAEKKGGREGRELFIETGNNQSGWKTRLSISYTD